MNSTDMNTRTIILVAMAIFVWSCGGSDNPTSSDPEPNPKPEPTTGTIEITTQTTGKDKDDAYTITVNGSNSTSADSSDTVYLTNLEEGSYKMQLNDIAENCSVDGDNPKNVSVTAGDTTATSFDVECKAIVSNQIAFVSDRNGNGDIFIMNADGSSQKPLIASSDMENYPSLSPNGTRIAYGKAPSGTDDYQLYVADVDGSNETALTSGTGGAQTIFSSWSPDGKKIAFTTQRDGNYEVYTMNSDGSAQTNISRSDSLDGISNASWSPDGNKILFYSKRGQGTDFEIYLGNTDGSGMVQLTDNTYEDRYPSWSPDGSKIMFTSNKDGDSEIFVMNADGSGVVQLTNNSVDDNASSWSSDGTEITFTRYDDNIDIYKINVDGSGLETNLSSYPGADVWPNWSN